MGRNRRALVVWCLRVGLCLFGHRSVHAAVVFDAKFESGAAAQSSPFTITSNTATVPGTIGGSATVLIAFLSSGNTIANTTLTGITWNGVAMTAIGSANTGGAVYGSQYIYGLISPATGNHNLVATWGGAAMTVVLGAISYTGSDTSTAWSDFTTATGTSTSETITVPNVTASDAVAVFSADENSTSMSITAGTLDWDERALNGNYGGAHRAGSGTVAWTLGSSVAWDLSGVRVIAASGGGGSTPNALGLIGVGK